jgi:tryptophan halogenase
MRLLVLGGGIAGLSTALALRKAMPGAAVTLVAIPPDMRGFTDRIGAAGGAMARVHAALGIDHADLAARIGGLAEAGSTFVDWAGPGSQFTIRRGIAMQFVDGIARHQLWLRNRTEGFAPAQPWAEGAVAADTGLRFDVEAYGRLLAGLLGRFGIEVAQSAAVRIETGAADTIEAVTTAEGQRLTADLYLDCTGPSALLMQALGAMAEPWPELPGLAVSGIAATRTAAAPHLYVGPVAQGLVLDTGIQSFRLEALLQAAPCGAFPVPWIGNVIAIGEAAAMLPPLEGQHFELLHAELLRLMALLPSGRGAEVRGEYVRRARQARDYRRDWCAAHWPERGPHPEGLAHLLAQFDARGRLPVRDGDPIAKGEWIDLLIGLGRAPARIDPTALAVSPQAAARLLQARAVAR